MQDRLTFLAAFAMFITMVCFGCHECQSTDRACYAAEVECAKAGMTQKILPGWSRPVWVRPEDK